MFEKINEMPNKLNENNYSNEKNINLIIQFMVDGYLKSKGQPLMKELLNELGIEDKAGVIYDYHIAFIQSMLNEELSKLNVNLDVEIYKTGEKFELGKLSSLEKSYLEEKINNAVGLIEVIKEKLEK